MDRIILRPFTPRDRQGFADMMYDYFNSDLKEELSYERLSVVVARIEYEMNIYPLYLNILTAGERPIGFVIFQIDTPENPWGLKPGWGFIREMYINKRFRRRGLGRSVVAEVFRFLRDAGVNNAYLTADSDGSRVFWQSLGFVDSGEICEKNELSIYIRRGI